VAPAAWEKRAMPNKVLCPKCHGQRTVSCGACHGSGKTSVAGITIGTCEECNGTGQRCCDVCGGSAEVERADSEVARTRSG
jgi:DnaJ-class molecular chaperone